MIGSNLTLSPRSPTKPSPVGPGALTPRASTQTQAAAPAQKPAQQYAGTMQKPRYITDDSVEDSVNNAIASGWQSADSRYLTKKMAGSGVSMGKGQEYVASQLGAGAVSDAAAEAAGIRTEAASANAKMRQDYEKAQEDERQAQQMARHASSQASWSKKFAEQSAQAQLQMAMQQAQLQLYLALMNQD